MRVGKIFRSYFLPGLPEGDIGLDILYSAVAMRYNEARQTWLERVKSGAQRLNPLTPKQREQNIKRGRSDRPLVGGGKFLRDVAGWPMTIQIREISGNRYVVQAWLESGESVKVLREGEDGEKELDLADIYQELEDKTAPASEAYWEDLLKGDLRGGDIY